MWRFDLIVVVIVMIMHLYLHLGVLLLRLRLRLLCFALFFRLAIIGAPWTLLAQSIFSGCIAWPDIGANPVLQRSLPIPKRKAKKKEKKRGGRGRKQAGVIFVK